MDESTQDIGMDGAAAGAYTALGAEMARIDREVAAYEEKMRAAGAALPVTLGEEQTPDGRETIAWTMSKSGEIRWGVAVLATVPERESARVQTGGGVVYANYGGRISVQWPWAKAPLERKARLAWRLADLAARMADAARSSTDELRAVCLEAEAPGS